MDEQCSTCRILPRLLGKNFFLPLFGREYPKLFYTDIKECFEGLDVSVIGGLKTRGWTSHDIDITGDRESIPVLVERLRHRHIPNPIHFCERKPNHSHLRCAWNGIKLTLTGKGY